MELALALSLAEAGGAAPPPDADAELAAALAASLTDVITVYIGGVDGETIEMMLEEEILSMVMGEGCKD